jgi:hypothetical protein
MLLYKLKIALEHQTAPSSEGAVIVAACALF